MEIEKEEIRIGHREDAISLLEQMIDVCETSKNLEHIDWWQVRLEALKNAVERGII